MFYKVDLVFKFFNFFYFYFYFFGGGGGGGGGGGEGSLNPGHGVDFLLLLLLRLVYNLIETSKQVVCVSKHNNILYTKILIPKMSLTHKTE